ncbi:MAG: glycosyl transferase [Hungatella sp.]|nr:glycosyl transferase [Hungatella sp.]
MKHNPDKFILGIRDFSDKSIPLRSRFGNNCTTFVFRFFCGLDIQDTQTGLKGIPASLIPKLMETPGERFEYASSVLLETKKQGINILQFPIKTIYINNNETSHFNPLMDSIRIYSLILKYLFSSLSAFVLDIIAFSVFLTILENIMKGYIITATYMAKAISCTYSFFINKNLVFSNKGESFSIVVKFIILCVAQASFSGILVNGFVCLTAWYEVICKVIVDTALFFVSFQVQNRWVFRDGD